MGLEMQKAYDGEHNGNRWKAQLDGGHVKKQNLNKTCIGICLIGNFELRSPTAKQMNSLEGLCEYLMRGATYQKVKLLPIRLFILTHRLSGKILFDLSKLLNHLNP